MDRKIGCILATGVVTIAAAWSSANAGQGRELLLSGPIQKVDHGTDTITVLGQTFHARTGQLSLGEVVRVYGVLQKDGSVGDPEVQGTQAFGTNGDPVFLKGVVTNADAAVGHVEVDGLTVDYTSQLANSQFINPAIGDVIAVAGLQPTSKGILMAAATGDAAYSSQAGDPTGIALPSAASQAQIQGDGAREAQIQGGGRAKEAQIQGGGRVKAAQIQGGGDGR